MTVYAHAEAFCLMTYRTDDGSDEEIIWNSRDGVTPFVISLRSGKGATHVDWHNDRQVPDHRPQPGDRIFVDMTEERALEIARKNIEYWTNNGFNMNGAPTVENLAKTYLHPGAPDLIEVK